MKRFHVIGIDTDEADTWLVEVQAADIRDAIKRAEAEYEGECHDKHANDNVEAKYVIDLETQRIYALLDGEVRQYD